MITGIFGLPGRGKTYEAVRRVKLQADTGRQCFSTTPIFDQDGNPHPNVEMIEYTDLADPFLPPGLILLDEVQLFLSARAGRKLDKRFYEKLSQTRKDGHDLIYTSQHESLVLKQLRDNTNWGIITWSWGMNNGHPVMFTGKMWEMWKIRRGKPDDKYWHFFDKDVAKAYDTRYAIQANEAVEGYDSPETEDDDG